MSGAMLIGMTNPAAQRLGEAIRARRRELKMTQVDIQEAGGPSTATLRLIEGGKHVDFRPGTIGPLERILQWREGSIASILDGEGPREIAQQMAPASDVLEQATTAWRDLKELVESPDDDPRRQSKAEGALISTADLLMDVLLALNAGTPAKPLIQEMANTVYELWQLDKGDLHVVDSTATSGTSPEAVKDEEVKLGDDPESLGRLGSALHGVAVEQPKEGDKEGA